MPPILDLYFKTFEVMCRQECSIDWSVYFRASKNDLETELEWARNRDSVQSQGEWGRDLEWRKDLETSVFDTVLNDTELKYLAVYRDICPNGVVMLGQNPANHPQHNVDKSRLHTISCKAELYSMKHKLWLTPTQLLLAHNYPIEPQLNHV